MIEKIVLLTGFALVLLGVNLKAGSSWLKLVTLVPALACLAGAGWFVFLVVIR